MNIFVGNLNYQTTESQLQEIFEPFGPISSVKIITDNYTNRSRGFGFVDMPETAHGAVAIEKLNNTNLQDNTIVVNEARPKTTGSGNGFKKRY